MEQGRGELALHPLSEGQLANLLVQDGPKIQQIRELLHRLEVVAMGNFIDRAVHEEGFARRQVPDQLVLLPHHQRDLAKKLRLAIKGAESADADFSAGRKEQARQNLQRCGLSCAVGPEESHDFPFPDFKGHILNRPNGLVLPREERLQGAKESGLLVVHFVELGKMTDRYLDFHDCARTTELDPGIPVPISTSIVQRLRRPETVLILFLMLLVLAGADSLRQPDRQLHLPDLYRGRSRLPGLRKVFVGRFYRLPLNASCHVFVQAVEKYGIRRGLVLLAKRLFSCNRSVCPALSIQYRSSSTACDSIAYRILVL